MVLVVVVSGIVVEGATDVVVVVVVDDVPVGGIGAGCWTGAGSSCVGVVG